MTDHTELDAFIASLALTYNAVFVPQSASRNAGAEHKSLNWRIALGNAQRPNAIATDYMQGIGHVPKPTEPRAWGNGPWTQVMLDQRRDPAAETGRYTDGFKEKKVQPPRLRDVLYSLVLDASVLDSRSFEDWASEYDYNTDSRKAEETYRACRDIAYKLEALVGRPALGKLRELFQDY